MQLRTAGSIRTSSTVIVNGVATWTVGITNGVNRTWEENKIGAAVYVLAFAILSLFIGWQITVALLPVNAGIGTMMEFGALGFGIGMLHVLFILCRRRRIRQ